MAGDILNTGITAAEHDALKGIESRFGNSVVSYLVHALRDQVQQLHGHSSTSMLPSTSQDASPPVVPHSNNSRWKKAPKTAPELAVSLARVIANSAPFPSDAIVQRLRLWSNTQGIQCSSHQETVAAILSLYIHLADELAQQYVDKKPTLAFQPYKDKARNSAAKAVWWYDPEAGDLEASIRQRVAEGCQLYEEHGPSRSLGAKPNVSLRFSSKYSLAQMSYRPIFTYAATKNPGGELSFALKQAAHDSLIRQINVYNPLEHGDDFAAFAYPTIYADIDRALAVMQGNEAQPVDGDLTAVDRNVDAQCPTAGSSTADVEGNDGASVVATSDDGVSNEGNFPHVPLADGPAAPPVEPASDDSPVATLRIDDPHMVNSPSQKPLSKLRKSKLAAAVSGNHQPQDGDASTSGVPAPSAQLGTAQQDRQMDAVALELCLLQDVVIDYVNKQERGGNFARTFDAALAVLKENYGNVAKSDALRALQLQGHKHPKNAPLQKAADAILQRAIASFRPPNGSQKYFRGHLHAAIEEDVVAEYTSHR
ncbi:hypothetical protein A3C37_01220 [Candidatus Peribacteria bacterium RIFCSPHIGHO2_02_FULL_53_20]|nr:MAG: hypothetical protein A3C37_01220 [Candidatus Peribacteria bacterium RIFCSPHIGHO2_02_FULL_53_20]OGJ68288.1 MAG: hypothetical protein A3B61_01640 [Candidatus Peribacteria bacterium RIFCSPLOWO2_01_FULL_53_10]OGJ73631.1 MAG: hypothetical protein A3G69_00570 [Candidatus Peribacteria bacterium RIFCSPLOWO2_12_FULL_53_10]